MAWIIWRWQVQESKCFSNLLDDLLRWRNALNHQQAGCVEDLKVTSKKRKTRTSRNTFFQKHHLDHGERERECGFAPSKEQENTLTQWRVLHSPSGWWRSRIRTRQTQGSPTRWASSPRSFAWLCAVHQKTQQGVTGGVCVVGVWLGGWTTGQRLNQAG